MLCRASGIPDTHSLLGEGADKPPAWRKTHVTPSCADEWTQEMPSMRELSGNQNGLGKGLDWFLVSSWSLKPMISDKAAFSEVTWKDWFSFIQDLSNSMLSCSSSCPLPNKAWASGNPWMSQSSEPLACAEKKLDISAVFEDAHSTWQSRFLDAHEKLIL